MSPKTATITLVHSDDDAAKLLLTTTRCMARWRARGIGPKFVKIGRRVAYRDQDLEDWLTKQTRTSTAPGRR